MFGANILTVCRCQECYPHTDKQVLNIILSATALWLELVVNVWSGGSSNGACAGALGGGGKDLKVEELCQAFTKRIRTLEDEEGGRLRW